MIKVFEYKKAAKNMRTSTIKSQINDELNESEFNTSASEDDILEDLEKLQTSEKTKKTETGSRMSKILEDLESDEDKNTMKIEGIL